MCMFSFPGHVSCLGDAESRTSLGIMGWQGRRSYGSYDSFETVYNLISFSRIEEIENDFSSLGSRVIVSLFNALIQTLGVVLQWMRIFFLNEK